MDGLAYRRTRQVYRQTETVYFFFVNQYSLPPRWMDGWSVFMGGLCCAVLCCACRVGLGSCIMMGFGSFMIMLSPRAVVVRLSVRSFWRFQYMGTTTRGNDPASRHRRVFRGRNASSGLVGGCCRLTSCLSDACLALDADQDRGPAHERGFLLGFFVCWGQFLGV